MSSRRVWRYQMGNQNPYFEEEQTTQWPKEKVQKDKQQSTKHTHKTKDQVTRTPKKRGWTQVLLMAEVYSIQHYVIKFFSDLQHPFTPPNSKIDLLLLSI